VVELVAVEVEPADERAHRAVLRVEGNEGRLHLGKLDDLPGLALRLAMDADDRAAAECASAATPWHRASARRSAATRREGDWLSRAQRRFNLLGVHRGDDRREEIVVVGVLVQSFFEVVLVRLRRQLGEAFGAAVAVAPVVVENPLAQRGVRRLLVGFPEGGVDAEAAAVDLVRIVLGDGLAHHLRGVFRVYGVFVHFPFGPYGRLNCLFVLRRSNVPQLGHPAQYVMLALLGALRVGDRVVKRRRLGQSREHRRLGEVELVERLAEVDLRSGAEAVGALAEIDLVDVKLEDLLLGQAVLDLECEQRLVQLAGERLLRREKEVAGHLHGDRARALAAPA
jgi:hypothetical protein